MLIELREYQAEDHQRLVQEALRDSRDLAILYGTAGGKTIEALAVLASLVAAKSHDFYMVTAPTAAILEQFEGHNQNTIRTLSGDVAVPKLVQCRTQIEFTHWLSRRDFHEVALVTHAILRECYRGVVELLREGLRGFMVSDEAHRTFIICDPDKDTQKLSRVVNMLTDLGLRQAKCTGTAYRASPAEKVIDFDPVTGDFCVSRTLPWLMLNGYCPGEIKSEILEVDCEGLSDDEDLYVPEQVERAAEAITTAWIRDGRPGAIVRIKHSNVEWNQRAVTALIDAFHKAGGGYSRSIKVINAVGEDSKELTDALKEEKRLLKAGASYEEIKHVIIAIHRATEGIDSPIVTHVYSFGVPTVINVLEQFIGRSMRLKFSEQGAMCPGFDERWINCAKVTLVVARMKDTNFEHAATLLKAALFMDSLKDIALIRRLLDIKDGFRRGVLGPHATSLVEKFKPEELQAARKVIAWARSFGIHPESDLFLEGGFNKGLWAGLIEAFVEEHCPKVVDLNGVTYWRDPLAKESEGTAYFTSDALRAALVFDDALNSPEGQQTLASMTQSGLNNGQLPADALMTAILTYYEEFRTKTLVPGTNHLHQLLAQTIVSFSGAIRQKLLNKSRSAPKSHAEVLAHVQRYRDLHDGRYPAMEEQVPGNLEWQFKEYDSILKHASDLPVVEGGLHQLLLDHHSDKPWHEEAQGILDDWQAKCESENLREREQTVGHSSNQAAIETLYGDNPIAAYYARAVLCLKRYGELAANLTVEEAYVLGRLPAYKEDAIRELVSTHGLDELRRRISCHELDQV